ncbi:biliverdin-producing heme oxygenase [Legionella fallonii]|uniref:Heme oxygenase n=1 Tax=Legionella fallonii LLAP-10 TaxID=1212491 RepID=A0A098FZS0_9GAMM|nr:biliverdin-producing heme oxygenase [Legionella fallonii]CEG55732.1 heme oxygenase [Legionella fallonii LLAP-10]
MLFSQALLAATYQGGKYGKRTDEHEKAEFHRFKTEHLFKNKKIPEDLYVARLIQHFVIIKAIETQLKGLEDKTPISAFFALTYIEQLWRTSGIRADLEQLDVNVDEIKDHQIAPATQKYLSDIKQLPPKALLAHFLMHVAGFMHGGNAIIKRYIEPSNALTNYQISTHQYDFSSIVSGGGSSLNVYNDMMKQMDTIELEEDEADEIQKQCTEVYSTMTSIYDDLCDMYTKQSKLPYYLVAVVTIGMIAIAWFFDVLSPIMNDTNSYNPRPG